MTIVRSPQEVQRFGQKKIPGVGQVQEKGRFQERRWPPSLGTRRDHTKDDDYDNYDEGNDVASLRSDAGPIDNQFD